MCASQMNSIKQIGCRNMGFRVEIMEWSNKMDLIAIGNDKGEVIIQRLNWQKIVTFPSPGDNLKVRAISWQPDETLIAVGYSNGKVSLLDVEKEEQVYSLKYEDDIQTIYWTKPVNALDYRQGFRNRSEICHAFFLPPLPNLSALSSTAKRHEDHKSFAKGSPCYLVVCLTSAKIYLQILGALPCGHIDLTRYVRNPDELKILNIRMNASYDGVYVIMRDGGTIKTISFLNGILHMYTSPLLSLASNYAHVLETQNYIHDTIQCMIEAWETVLLEMDNKLMKYANSQPEGSLSADFLELLMFGYASTELEQFLTNDLTEKGLKKLGNSIEMSYFTIQNLVTKPLLRASVNLCFYLNNFKGMSRNTHFYKDLITPEAVDEAICASGSFLMKILEVQQIIDQCMNDMKVFFCWLCVAIVRLMNETVSEEMAQVSQEDIIYLADYLNSFDDCLIKNEDGTMVKRKFNLEKVGQYLENADLQQPSKYEVHHRWNRLLQENECLKDCTLLFPHDKKLSLLQQRDKMNDAIGNVFLKPDTSISNDFKHIMTIICATDVPVDYKLRSSFVVNEAAKCDTLAMTLSHNEIIIIEFQFAIPYLKVTKLNLQPTPQTPINLLPGYGNLTIVDLQFYNEAFLSILFQSSQEEDCKPQNFFVQMQLDTIRGKHSQHQINQLINLAEDAPVPHSLFDVLDGNSFKPMEGYCTDMTVSGSRKVAAVLSDNCKKIGIYELEVEDDDEDVEMLQNSFLDTRESVMNQTD